MRVLADLNFGFTGSTLPVRDSYTGGQAFRAKIKT